MYKSLGKYLNLGKIFKFLFKNSRQYVLTSGIERVNEKPLYMILCELNVLISFRTYFIAYGAGVFVIKKAQKVVTRYIMHFYLDFVGDIFSRLSF
jgi:hypothetical protein